MSDTDERKAAKDATGPVAMVEQRDKKIREAYAQAADCAERAKSGDMLERNHWLVLERRWLTLARSIEYNRGTDTRSAK